MSDRRAAVLLAAVFLPLVTCQLVFDPEASAKKKEPAPQLTFDGITNPECPEREGVYEDATFCDAYWKCQANVAQEIFCADGLVFDIKKSHTADPCDTPHVVHCGNRQELQEPSFPSEFCPRRFGTFEHPDPTVCNIYYQCVDGKSTEVSCATGLYFNSTQGNCNWPAIAMRTGCVDKPKMSQDGAFSCPEGPHQDSTGRTIPHPSFPHVDDCTKFYVCLNGVTPQEASCDKGMVFNEKTMLCDLPENVELCVGWFANDPEFAHYYDDVAAGGADVDFTG